MSLLTPSQQRTVRSRYVRASSEIARLIGGRRRLITRKGYTDEELPTQQTINTKLNLLGWSWGTSLMATYTTQNPEKVERLALYAPQWIRTTASLVQSGPGPLPA